MKFTCLYLPGECGMCPKPKIKYKFRCKHCKCPVIDRFDTRPLLGFNHGKHCPRRNK